MPLYHNSHVTTFGDIASLMDVFHDAKKLRRARSPSYVMVVEDDLLTRRIVSNSFKEQYAMISACTAYEAVADYLLYAPDVVFLDIGLPEIDGFAALEMMLTIDPDAFIVMFSSNDYPNNVEQAEKLGAKGFVSKPFKKDVMQRFIHGSAFHHHKSA